MCPRIHASVIACRLYYVAFSILTGSISPLMRGLHEMGAYSSVVETSVNNVDLSVFCTERLRY